jgi:hypothetical protein
MTNDSPDNGAAPASVRAWQGWWPLAVTAALSAVVFAIIVRGREDKPNAPSEPGTRPDAAAHKMIRVLPRPETLVAVDAVQPQCNIVAEERDGTQVLRIRTHEFGDELIVDAVTGRLVAVRDSMGRTISVPMPPVTGAEHPAKSS